MRASNKPTTVEVSVVIAIIGILLALAIPQYSAYKLRSDIEILEPKIGRITCLEKGRVGTGSLKYFIIEDAVSKQRYLVIYRRRGLAMTPLD